ncbi:MAG: HAD-IA family hydrolase [Chromatiales bacterium]|jgi:beta-phosphoglucomutase-like phosphatase (HAD superfamily)|nr:HAD-IA family hydrolase [Chromatiales bacterium]
MSSLKALLFDVDGTLADTERDGHRIAFNRAFADAGLDWQWSEQLYGRLLVISGGKERMEYYLRNYVAHGEPDPQLLALIPKLHTTKNRYYWDMLERGEIGLRPGVARLLRAARSAGLRLAIATTTTGTNVSTLLRSTLGEESLGWFELMATADEVSDKKPSPAVYEYCLDHLGLAAHECLAFEDSENGMAATRAAGIPVLITVNDYTRDGDYRDAELVVESLGEPQAPTRVLGGRAAARVAASVTVDLDLLRTLRAS